MADNARPPSVPPPTDPDGSVHHHTEEIERSKSRAGSDRPGSAANPLPPVGGIRSGRSAAYDARPGSGARPVSRPGSSTSMSLTASASEELTMIQMAKKDPLPPINAKDSDDEAAVTDPTESASGIIANTMAGGANKTRQVAKLPRVVSYRPGLEDDDLANLPMPEPPPKPEKTLSLSLAVAEEKTVVGKDGVEMVVKSIDCQTEWSWLKDMQRMSSTPGGKFSRASTTRAPTQTPGGLGEEEEDVDLEIDPENITKSGPSRQSDRRASRAASEQSHAGSKSQRSQRSKADPAGQATPGQDVAGVQPGYTDDTYGIPILELSSDSDSSDDEAFDEEKFKKKAAEAAAKENMVLPSIGPPQILQYQRESDKQQMNPDEEEQSAANAETIFEGICEFCGANIKPFPSLEDQNNLPPTELYCCDEYREFLQFMLTQAGPPPEVEEKEKLIDIAPHPPHGSKQARRAAKERAAQRMREREIQRQQAAISGMSGGFGGGGGGGGNSNFYQSNTGPQGHKVTPAYSRLLDRKEEKPDSDSAQTYLPGTKSSSDSFPRGGMRSRRGSVATSISFYAMSMVARQMKTINYQLSSQKCLEEGWTLRPPSPMLDMEPDADVFEPQPILPPWAEGASKDKKEAGLVQKYYPDGNKFVILFPDGTGNVYYPSGRVAVSISSVEKGLYTYLAHADSDDEPNVLAMFDPDGHATSYHPNGMVRICLDPMGGTELDPRGCRKRKWTWKDQVQHVHAPPIQPITFAVTSNISVRISGQDAITLTFSHSAKSCRFQVGARLKVVCPENAPPPELDEDLLYRNEVKNRIETLFAKVTNLLKFPKSPKLDKLPGPAHVTSRQEKSSRLRESYSRSAKADKDKKGSMPVITVN